MIRLTVELLSAVHPSRNRVLGVAHISNVGGDADRANYQAELFNKTDPDVLDFKATLSKFDGEGIWKQGTVRAFPRLVRGPWDILYRCLVACGVGQRNP